MLRAQHAAPYKGKRVRRVIYRDAGAAEATAVLPMASPLTTSSTRRVRWGPSGVSLEATGCVLPEPWAVMGDGPTPLLGGKSRKGTGRRSVRLGLKLFAPVSAVCASDLR